MATTGKGTTTNILSTGTLADKAVKIIELAHAASVEAAEKLAQADAAALAAKEAAQKATDAEAAVKKMYAIIGVKPPTGLGAPKAGATTAKAPAAPRAPLSAEDKAAIPLKATTVGTSRLVNGVTMARVAADHWTINKSKPLTLAEATKAYIKARGQH